MEKIDLGNVLYHGFMHCLSPTREDKSIERLDSILKCGAILSRNQQKIMLNDLGLPLVRKLKILRNEVDYISVCSKFGTNGAVTEPFSDFVETGMSLVLDNSILDSCVVRDEFFQDGEVQIKDSIPATFFRGIAVNFVSDEKMKEKIKAFVKKGETLKSSKDYFSGRYKVIEKLRTCLDENGFDYLPIYSIDDGCQITNIDNILSQMGDSFEEDVVHEKQ